MILKKHHLQMIFMLLILILISLLNSGGIVNSILLTSLIIYIILCGYKNFSLLTLSIFMFSDYGYGLLPINISIWGMKFSSSDLAIVMLFVLTIYCVFQNKSKIRINGKIIAFIFAVLCFVVCSAIQAGRNTGQSILTGIMTQRQLLSYICLPILYSFISKDKLILSIKEGAYWGTWFSIIIYGIQYGLLYFGGITFLTCTVSYRILIRLHIYIRTMFVLFIILLTYVYKNNGSKKDYWLLCLIVTYCAVIGQYRMLSLGLLSCLFIAFYLGNSGKYRRIYKVLIVFLLVVSLPLINMIFVYLTEGMRGAVASASIRLNATNYYDQLLEGHRLLGFGSINNTGGRADTILGTNYGFYLIDLGVYAIKFMYGQVGYIFFILLMLYMLYWGYCGGKKYGNPILLLFAAFSLITSSTLLTSYYYSSSIILLILVGFTKNEEAYFGRSSNIKL